MLKLGLGIDRNVKKITAGTTFDPDATAFFNRVTAAGGSLTATEQNAINTLVLDLKGFGVWTNTKAIYPMVGASAAACSQNLKSASYTGTFSSGWTFASTGVTPNGTSAYMDTNYNQTAVGDSLNSGNLTFYSRTDLNAATTRIDMGVIQPAVNYNLFQLRTSNISYTAINSTGLLTYNPDPNSLGFYIVNRQLSNDVDFWKNGTKVVNGTTASVTLPNANIFIGAVCINFVIPSDFSTRQCAFASIGAGLTDTQATNFYTAVQAFNTTLSRQV